MPGFLRAQGYFPKGENVHREGCHLPCPGFSPCSRGRRECNDSGTPRPSSGYYAIYRGWSIILVPRPTPDIIIELTLKYRPSMFGGVPTMFVGLLNHPKFAAAKLDFIKGCFSGAAPLALETIRDWEKATGSIIVELYGLSETTALATFNPWRGKTKIGSVGVPIAETECRIVDVLSGTKDMKQGEDQMGQNFYLRDDRDVKFVLKEHLGVERLLDFAVYGGFSMDDFDMILDQAQKISAKDIAPTFQDGDRQGCRFEQGKVYVPESFHHCWDVFREGGWFSLAMKTEYGGQGLPLIIAEAAYEFFMSANFGFCCFSGMGAGNGNMIENYGSPRLKDLFCRKMYDGTWGGTMCLTEPGVGSDAHMVTTKATPDGATYRLQGTKIFITSGEHDLTENIIHLVIARIEGAPSGAKGVSLFAVPKIRVNDDGSLGEGNDVACIGIEHKMGMNASATCILNFGENGNCRGHLIGEPGRGLTYMFQMVNGARMSVGLEAVAFGANIYANVLAYARQRVQGTPFGSGSERVRIVEHADVRRMLMNIKSLTEGMRALVYKSYFVEDLSKNCPEEADRKKAKRRLELLTPLVKSYCSDRIFEIGREGIQILGGYGFTKEYPVEQYTRDCKILSIWDGTNFIQSADLVGRKLNMAGVTVFSEWVEEVTAFVREHRSHAAFGQELVLLEEAIQTIVGLAMDYGRYFTEGKLNLIPLTSTRFLDCMAEVAIGHLFLEQGFIALKKLESGDWDVSDQSFYRGKVDTVRYFCRNFLPQVFGRARIIKMEDMTAMQISEDDL